jgi:hypothetical protein
MITFDVSADPEITPTVIGGAVQGAVLTLGESRVILSNLQVTALAQALNPVRQRMTAIGIVAKWDTVSEVFIKTGTWMQFLRLVAIGDEGCSIGEWNEKIGGNPPRRQTFNRWQKAGLVTYTETFRSRTKIIQRTWRVTPKALRLLRLEA